MFRKFSVWVLIGNSVLVYFFEKYNYFLDYRIIIGKFENWGKNE